MRRLVFIITLIFLVAAPAFGLSDAEYRKFKSTNSNFRRADNELTEIWKELKNSLSAKAFSDVQKSQREWIRKGRDEDAASYIKQGYSRAEAYAMATIDRTEDLAQILRPEPEPEPEPEPQLDNPEGNYSSRNGFMTVIITDKTSMEAAVTITINSPKQVTWSSESWIDGDTLALYDKRYSDCEVVLTFSGNTIIAEASDSPNWNHILGEGITLSGTYVKSQR